MPPRSCLAAAKSRKRRARAVASSSSEDDAFSLHRQLDELSPRSRARLLNQTKTVRDCESVLLSPKNYLDNIKEWGKTDRRIDRGNVSGWSNGSSSRNSSSSNSADEDSEFEDAAQAATFFFGAGAGGGQNAGAGKKAAADHEKKKSTAAAARSTVAEGKQNLQKGPNGDPVRANKKGGGGGRGKKSSVLLEKNHATEKSTADGDDETQGETEERKRKVQFAGARTGRESVHEVAIREMRRWCPLVAPSVPAFIKQEKEQRRLAAERGREKSTSCQTWAFVESEIVLRCCAEKAAREKRQKKEAEAGRRAQGACARMRDSRVLGGGGVLEEIVLSSSSDSDLESRKHKPAQRNSKERFLSHMRVCGGWLRRDGLAEALAVERGLARELKKEQQVGRRPHMENCPLPVPIPMEVE
mmetsp:Transcript_16692/g.41296  ORF Transcript_16692/g.41296 Transcript_16692/m.41296 type:complete len:414 (-) Transcript_16692:221-1462(-)|eukprot:CAMPEP_0178994042 /NCGR_PEP_ID=MMETSP0795-20121207/7054_1 /TAXON_ID=88552 /ORGANISM="Amoebophrya sp., Strain Ameob2" /LENGTH=413 /DNA_ID=CAMNT_0020686199 /DNA_START=174 /DNA_END=1415 /DNA_ORIENTATION=+